MVQNYLKVNSASTYIKACLTERIYEQKLRVLHQIANVIAITN